MQIVIDIPEDFIDKMNSIEDDRELSQAQLLTVYRGFHAMLQHGIPIPKGHGDLIDRDELYFLKAIHDAKFEKISWADAIRKIKYSAPTIVKGVV